MMTDTLVVTTEDVTLDLLLWRYYGRQIAGLVEDTFTRNPGLADLGVHLPVGTRVAVARPAATANDAQTVSVVTLYD